MKPSQDADLSQFSMLDLFRMEAHGQTQTLSDGLLALEHGADAGTIEAMMRAAHSIKGAAAIVGLDVVVQLAHAMEDAFVAAQRGQLAFTPLRIDALLAGVDLILQFSALRDADLDAWLAQHAARVAAILASIAGIALLGPTPAPAPARGAGSTPEAVPRGTPARPVPSNFDRLLALASQSRINAHQLRPMIQSLQRFKRKQSSLVQTLEQLHEAIARSGDAALLEKSAQALQEAGPLKQFVLGHLADAEGYERRLLNDSKRLVDEVLALRMRPFRDGVQAFPRMVRDLARSLGKDARLLIAGEETLVDRDILASIESPLNHMLRNAVDHGIESPDQRLAAGKPALGTVRLTARHRAGMLSIEIDDDGSGVDLERIRRVVVERRMTSAAMAEAMSAAELTAFLFLPGFSLKDSADTVSGRGVGLDIVHQTIHAQNGTVRIEAAAGTGMRATITLPLTQSILRVLVVEVQGEAYAIPIVKVDKVMKVAQADVHTLGNRQFFEAGGEHLGLVSAAQVLELGQLHDDAAELAVVVIGAAPRRYALVVDAICGEQSLAVQSLEPVFGKLRDISAAALLDDGAAVLILDVPDLLLSIDKLLHAGGLHQLARDAAADRAHTKRILVVDDSLTVREMERKLLLGRGYQVDVAVDGIDGWNLVRSGHYDLVVTDVDMPRMDGIDLVALIRRDVHLHKLPVMIVSYKDRPEDRARGMAAGADYYLTKGSFHDATLLDAVSDLIGEAGA